MVLVDIKRSIQDKIFLTDSIWSCLPIFSQDCIDHENPSPLYFDMVKEVILSIIHAIWNVYPVIFIDLVDLFVIIFLGL